MATCEQCEREIGEQTAYGLCLRCLKKELQIINASRHAEQCKRWRESRR